MEQVEVWRGAHGDPTPLFGPLPGVRIDDTLAYEFQLPDRFVPRPGYPLLVPTDGRHQRLLDLDDYADAIEGGQLDVHTAIDGLRRWQRFLDTHLHAARDPRDRWADFPPQRLRELAALSAPLGPVVTAPD